MTLTEIITTAASGAGITWLSIYLFGQSLLDKAVKQVMDKDLETFKSKLGAEVEEFRSKLQLELVKNSLYHTKRAEKACEIFAAASYCTKALTVLHARKTHTLRDASQEDLDNFAEAKEHAMEMSEQYLNCYLSNSLYFEDDIIKALEAFHRQGHQAWDRIEELTLFNASTQTEVIEAANKAHIKAKRLIADKFRPLLQ